MVVLNATLTVPEGFVCAGAGAPAVRAMRPSKEGAEKILLVEDEQLVRGVIKEVLVMDGYAVTEAFDGEEGLRLFSKGRYDLVITDLEMPRITGGQLVREIRQLDPDQRIMIVSARPAASLPQVNEYVGKPFDIAELRAAVRRALQSENQEGRCNIA